MPPDAQQTTTDQERRLAEHDAKPYAERDRIERAISAFLGIRANEPMWCIPLSDVRSFVACSVNYRPLIAAVQEACANAR